MADGDFLLFRRLLFLPAPEGRLTMTQKINLLMSDAWKGHSCFVVGGGPSLRGFDWDRLRREFVIGTNCTFEYCDPTILLAIDPRFYEWVREGKYGAEATRKLADYKGLKVGIRICGKFPDDVKEIRSLGPRGPIIPVEQGIYHGNNSGYSAVALALALGANPVYMLGIDMRYDQGRQNFHEGHPETTTEKNLVVNCIQSFVDLSFTEEGKRVKIVNLQWPGSNFSRLSMFFDETHFLRSEYASAEMS